MDIIKIAVLGIAGVLIAIPLKREKSEYSLFIAMTVCICIFLYLLTKVGTILDFIRRLETVIPIDSRYIGILIKWWESPMWRNLRSTSVRTPDMRRLPVRLRFLQSCRSLL